MEALRAKFEPLIKERFTLLKNKVTTAKTLTELYSYQSQIELLTQQLSTQINAFIASENERLERERKHKVDEDEKTTGESNIAGMGPDSTTKPSSKQSELIHKNNLIPMNYTKIETEEELNALLVVIHNELEKVLEQGKTIRFI